MNSAEVTVRDLAQVWYRSDPSGHGDIMVTCLGGVNADGPFFWDFTRENMAELGLTWDFTGENMDKLGLTI